LNSDDKSEDDILKGTTLRVYRFLFREGKPLSAREVQRGLGLSSPSVAEYHLKKLVQAGAVREVEEGFAVDRTVWRNMIRMRRTIIPLQAFYSVFFAAALWVMLLVFRNAMAEGYLFGLLVMAGALCLSLYQTARALRESI